MTDRVKGQQGQANRRALGRRTLLTRLAGSLGLAVPFSVAASRRPAADDPSAFMAQAVRMRDLAVETGDQEYGAVVVKHGRIVGQAPSRVVVNRDPTAHAEMEAIRDAARNLGTRDLGDCVLYSTSRACPTCEAAAYWANIKGMRFGTTLSDAGTPQLRRC